MRPLLLGLLGLTACAPQGPDDLQAQLAQIGALRGLAPATLEVMGDLTGQDGARHVRVRQLADGVPVEGGGGILHLDPGGRLTGFTDGLIEHSAFDPRPTVSRREALTALGDLTPDTPPTADLRVLTRGGEARLAWRLRAERILGGAPTQPVIFVDARSGEVLWRYEGLRTDGPASGTGRTHYDGSVAIDTYELGGDYYLEDTGRGVGTYSWENTTSGLFYLDDGNNRWRAGAQQAGVSAHWAAGVTLDLLAEDFGWDGLDGDGGPAAVAALDGEGVLITATVSYGVNYNNAFWTGTYLALGDGDGVLFDPLTSLDVIAHELGHGLTQPTAGFTYYGEPGALDESFADVLGALADAREGNDAWSIGEDCYTPGVAGDALRYLDDPTADGVSRAHYDDRYTGGADNGGVHINSGIPNRAFYLASEALGVDIAGAIWFRALTTGLTASSDFADARDATVDAAGDLYGDDEVAAVQDAWASVGVGDPAPEEDLCAGYEATYEGTLSGAGDRDFVPDGSSYTTSTSGLHEGLLTGPDAADFDLALFRYRGGRWRQVASSSGSDSSESISYSGAAGTYAWRVDSDDGGGGYTFCLSTP